VTNKPTPSSKRQEPQQDESPSVAGEVREFEITVASQREAFDLKACQTLLTDNDIPSGVSGRGFNQTVVVSRGNSGRAMDLIMAHRNSLVRRNPLSAGDYVVGIIAWAFGFGLAVPAGVGYLLITYWPFHATNIGVLIAVAMGAMVVGGILGYLRCRMIANRRKT